MPTLVVNTFGNGWIPPSLELWVENANYLTARNTAVGNVNNAAAIDVGQLRRTGPVRYRVRRDIFSFRLDPGAPDGDLPVGAGVISAVISGTEQVWVDNACDFHALDGTGLTGVGADYGTIRDMVTSLGFVSVPVTGLVPNYSYSIPLNVAGRALVAANAGGTVTFAFRNSREMDAIPPSGSQTEEIRLDKFIGAPYTILSIIYVTSLPTVTTDPATNVQMTSATLNGRLTADGGEPSDCGFEWGETPALGITTPIQSINAVNSFSQNITGLLPNRTYYFRAFATNVLGTGYGGVRSFTTKPSLIVATLPATGVT